jgi:nucleoid DNA-binding protein
MNALNQLISTPKIPYFFALKYGPDSKNMQKIAVFKEIPRETLRYLLLSRLNQSTHNGESSMAAQKKAPAKKKTTAAKATVTKSSVKKPPTKSEILNHLAEETGFTRKEVSMVLDSLSGLIAKNVKPRSAGLFSLPGLLKIKVVKKPARKARKGINPFTGEETMFKAKPASRVVKITALKGLKDML